MCKGPTYLDAKAITIVDAMSAESGHAFRDALLAQLIAKVIGREPATPGRRGTVAGRLVGERCLWLHKGVRS